MYMASLYDVIHSIRTLDDIKIFSILKNGIRIECQKSTKTS